MEKERPFVWAHRGTRRASPENTLESFLRAEWQGADGIELDVRLSLDGIPVVMHDESLKRTTGVDALVSELRLAEIKSLFPGVPSLEEALRIMGGRLGFNVELKSCPAGPESRLASLAEGVASLLSLYGRRDSCMVSSFDPRAIDAFKRASPGLRAGWLLRPAYLPGPRFPGRPRAFEAVHPHQSMLDRRFLDYARSEGKAVNAWTVNGLGRASRLAAWGVDGIITDLPGRIVSGLGGAAPKRRGEGVAAA